MSSLEINRETGALLRFSPRIILVCSILIFLISNDSIAIRFSGYYIIVELLGIFLKMTSGILFKGHSFIYRPKNGGHCTGCGVIPDTNCKNISKQIGMPSGHSMLAMMSATFWILYMYRKNSNSGLITRSVILFLLALSVVISRTESGENCHTIPQVTIGSLIGILLGYLLFRFDLRFQPKNINKN